MKKKLKLVVPAAIAVVLSSCAIGPKPGSFDGWGPAVNGHAPLGCTLHTAARSHRMPCSQESVPTTTTP